MLLLPLSLQSLRKSRPLAAEVHTQRSFGVDVLTIATFRPIPSGCIWQPLHLRTRLLGLLPTRLLGIRHVASNTVTERAAQLPKPMLSKTVQSGLEVIEYDRVCQTFEDKGEFPEWIDPIG